MTRADYYVRGCTALLDAVCNVRSSRPMCSDWKRKVDEDYKKRGNL